MIKPLLLVPVAAALASALAGLAIAKPLTYDLPPETETLRPGPGVDAAQRNCLACHSVDYVAIQAPNQGKSFWQAEVTKMINVYKAPIQEDDAKIIADYLAHAY